MKTSLIYFAAVLSAVMTFMQCSSTKTVPFDVEFTGTYNLVEPDSLLCGPGWAHIIVDCSGTGTPLGNFTGHFDFCADWEEGYYPGARIIAYMVAENGDTLFVKCEGQVLEGRLEDHPEYVVDYWRDPFEITGGTGKYEGATGEGMSDDYDSSEDENSHHHWKGTITMKR